jgi:tetratricopeptide (TPR) repeat protein
LKEGSAALETRQYDKALQAFQNANKLDPQNVEVLAGLSRAEAARESAAAERRKQEAEKARTTSPARPGSQADSPRRPTEGSTLPAQGDQDKKRQEELQRAKQARQLVSKGRTALSAKQLEAAEKAFGEAGKLAPNDPDVVRALQDLDQARKEAAGEAEKKKRQAGYQDAMKAGRRALAARRYEEAGKAFTEAGRLLPGDPGAVAMLKEVEKAQAGARAAQEAEARKKEEGAQKAESYRRFMAQGQEAMSAKRYPEAVKAFNQALEVRPGDPAAAKGQREAVRALEGPNGPRPQPPEQPAQPLTKPAPQQKTTPGPRGEPQAGASPPGRPETPPLPANAQPRFLKQMQAGAALEKQQKFAEAVRAYKDALSLFPGDAQATASLHAAEFSQHMAEGRKAMAARRFPDAAREFEDALKINPGSPEATNAIKRAREGRP